MKLIVTTPDSSEATQELVQKLDEVDVSLRKTYSGLEVETIVPEIRSSLDAIDVELSDADTRGYAQSIANRTDFTYALA